jgi:hypothetical protein
MTVLVTKGKGVIVIVAKAEGPEAIGDMAIQLRRGQSAFGKTYDEWEALPEGSHEVERWDSGT